MGRRRAIITYGSYKQSTKQKVGSSKDKQD
jgi:hypothetical protein